MAQPAHPEAPRPGTTEPATAGLVETKEREKQNQIVARQELQSRIILDELVGENKIKIPEIQAKDYGIFFAKIKQYLRIEGIEKIALHAAYLAPKWALYYINKYKNEKWAESILLEIAVLYPELVIERIDGYYDKEWALDVVLKAVSVRPQYAADMFGKYRKYPFAGEILLSVIEDKYKDFFLYPERYFQEKELSEEMYDLVATRGEMACMVFHIIKKIKNAQWAQKIALSAAKIKPEETLFALADYADMPWAEEVAMAAILTEKGIDVFVENLDYFSKQNLFNKMVDKLIESNFGGLCLKLIFARGGKVPDLLKKILNKHADRLAEIAETIIVKKMFQKIILESFWFKEVFRMDIMEQFLIVAPELAFNYKFALMHENEELAMQMLRFALAQIEENPEKRFKIDPEESKDLFEEKNDKYKNEFLEMGAVINPDGLIDLLKQGRENENHNKKILELLLKNLNNIKRVSESDASVAPDFLKKILDVEGLDDLKMEIIRALTEREPLIVLYGIENIKEKYPLFLPYVVEFLKQNVGPKDIFDKTELWEKGMRLYGDIIPEFKIDFYKKIKFYDSLAEGLLRNSIKEARIKQKRCKKDGKIKEANEWEKMIKRSKKYLLKDPALQHAHLIKKEWIEDYISVNGNINVYEFMAYIARGLWYRSKKVTKRNVLEELVRVLEARQEYYNKPIFKGRNTGVFAHIEKMPGGGDRFARPALIEAIRKQGGILTNENIFRPEFKEESLEKNKQNFLRFIAESEGPVTVLIDAHGKPEYFSFTEDLLPRQDILSKDVKKVLKQVTYQELGEALKKRNKNYPNEKDGIIIIFDICFSHTFIRNLYSYLPKKFNYPILVGVSEYNMIATSNYANKFGNDDYTNVFRMHEATLDRPTTFGTLMEHENDYYHNVSVYIPGNDQMVRQLTEAEITNRKKRLQRPGAEEKHRA